MTFDLRMLWRTALVAALFAVPGAALAQSADSVSGDARAIGPDIIQIDKTEVILLGIDAPEAHQICTDSKGTWKCGESAFAVMDQVAKVAPVTCTLKGGPDPFQRRSGTCLRADGTDIASEMVKQGMAVPYPRDPENAKYTADETAAKAAKIGLWEAGVKFDDPWVYRMKNDHSPLK